VPPKSHMAATFTLAPARQAKHIARCAQDCATGWVGGLPQTPSITLVHFHDVFINLASVVGLKAGENFQGFIAPGQKLLAVANSREQREIDALAAHG